MYVKCVYKYISIKCMYLSVHACMTSYVLHCECYVIMFICASELIHVNHACFDFNKFQIATTLSLGII